MIVKEETVCTEIYYSLNDRNLNIINSCIAQPLSSTSRHISEDDNSLVQQAK